MFYFAQRFLAFSSGILLLASLTQCGGSDENEFRGGPPKEGELYKQEEISLRSGDFEERFTQGETKDPVLERFEQGATVGKVDLMVVVDDSGSMSDEQTNLSNGLANLLSGLGNADWQVGVTTTSPNYDGTNCSTTDSLFVKSDRNAPMKFKELFGAGGKIGTNGFLGEAGLFKATEGLSGTCMEPSQKNWLRDNSTVAVLIISDEENCDEGACLDEHKDPMFLENYLTNTLNRKIGVDSRIYGLISVDGDGCSTPNNEKGTQYEAAINRSKGKIGRICGDQNEYKDVLDQISNDIGKLLNNKFDLSATPESSTVKVSVNGVEIPDSAYEITATGIHFKNAPADGSKIDINYVPESGIQTKNFTLKEPANKPGLTVQINGDVLDPSLYTLSDDGYIVTLNEAPELGSMVAISYDSLVQPKTVFRLRTGLDSSNLSIKIGDEFWDDWSYDITTGALTLNSFPEGTEKFIVRYKLPQ